MENEHTIEELLHMMRCLTVEGCIKSDELMKDCDRNSCAKCANRLMKAIEHKALELENETLDLRREFEDWRYDRDTCWVKLPVSADGKPIRVGDVMENSDGIRFVVKFMSLHDSEWRINAAGLRPSRLHHHHEPTVEDVLREFAIEIDPMADVDVIGAKVIAEYAKRLRLADKED